MTDVFSRACGCCLDDIVAAEVALADAARAVATAVATARWFCCCLLTAVVTSVDKDEDDWGREDV